MNPLQSFLGRFKDLLTSSESVKQAVASVLKNQKVNISEKDFDIKDGVLVVKAHPLTKNEVFMRKNLILRELKTLLGEKAPRDIR